MAKRFENLSHGRYLPVEVPAVDRAFISGLSRGIGLHMNSLAVEIKPGTVEPEVLYYYVHKLQEMWNGKRELLEELTRGWLIR